LIAISVLVILALTTVLALLLSGQPPRTTNVGTEWPVSSPEEQDMDAAKLEEMLSYINRYEMAVDGMVIVRHGHIVLEYYGPGYDAAKRHQIYSVTKSVVSMLVGVALDRGYIDSLDARLVDLLPQYTSAHPDPRRDQITLEHLLTMSDGIEWHEHDLGYDDLRNSVNQLWHAEDVVQFVLDQPMARQPGDSFAYNSGASILLGAIVETTTGRDLLGFANEVLFTPLGMAPVSWLEAGGDHYCSDGGLFMTPRDMARLGSLMMYEGRWNGQQILPKDWVRESTTARFATSGGYGYGYQWWILSDAEGYKGDGLYDQRIHVQPEADLVVAITAAIPGKSLHRVDGLLHTFILPACTDLDRRTGTATYIAPGFALKYPSGSLVQEMPLSGQGAAPVVEGAVQIASRAVPFEVFSVHWKVAETDKDLGELIDLYLAGHESTGVEVKARGFRDAETHDHPTAIGLAELGTEGGTLQSASAVWVCGESGQVFGVTYATAANATDAELVTALEGYLDGLACH
jgi:CubicO group peptidase (beta-lactamase class C family)